MSEQQELSKEISHYLAVQAASRDPIVEEVIWLTEAMGQPCLPPEEELKLSLRIAAKYGISLGDLTEAADMCETRIKGQFTDDRPQAG